MNAQQSPRSPLRFQAGDGLQFDWSEEHVVLGGISQKVKVAHFRLCHSRKPFVVACPGEPQLPDAMRRIKDHYMKDKGGDREFVDLLMLAQEHGIETVAVACELAVEQNTLRLPAIINLVNQLVEPVITPLTQSYDYPKLTMRPEANPCPAVHCKMHERGKRYETLYARREVVV